MYGTDLELYSALKNNEIDMALDEVYKIEYHLRKDQWKDSLSVAGAPIWKIDTAIAVSRPEGAEHPAFRYASHSPKG